MVPMCNFSFATHTTVPSGVGSVLGLLAQLLVEMEWLHERENAKAER